MKLHAAIHDDTEPDPVAVATRDFVLNGLMPASRSGADVFRAFFRSFNMLDAPDALLADPQVMQAALVAFAEGPATTCTQARSRPRGVPRSHGTRCVVAFVGGDRRRTTPDTAPEHAPP